MTFSKKQILLSIPGAFFALLGLSAIIEEGGAGTLIFIWGLMMTPVFWLYFDNLINRQTNWKHKLGGFFLVMILVVAIFPEPSTKTPAVGSFEANSDRSVAEETVAKEVPEITQETVEIEEITEIALSGFIPQNGVSETEQNRDDTLINKDTLVNQQNEQGNKSYETFLTGKVVSVTDGDTLKVSLNGVTETIRVIGIDTPETVHPSKPVECFGIEASNKAKALLNGTTVRLVTDKSQGERDRYGRFLAYVTLENGKDFGEEMIRGGFAYEYTYSGKYDNQATYKSAQSYASSNQVGLWAPGACEKPAEVTTPNPVVTAPTECNIKGNISSSGEKIYHVPGQQNYNDTIIEESKGERWFCTGSEAVAAGWRAAKR